MILNEDVPKVGAQSWRLLSKLPSRPVKGPRFKAKFPGSLMMCPKLESRLDVGTSSFYLLICKAVSEKTISEVFLIPEVSKCSEVQVFISILFFFFFFTHSSN